MPPPTSGKRSAPFAFAHVSTVDASAIWEVTVGTYDWQDAAEEWALHRWMRENGAMEGEGVLVKMDGTTSAYSSAPGRRPALAALYGMLHPSAGCRPVGQYRKRAFDMQAAGGASQRGRRSGGNGAELRTQQVNVALLAAHSCGQALPCLHKQQRFLVIAWSAATQARTAPRSGLRETGQYSSMMWTFMLVSVLASAPAFAQINSGSVPPAARRIGAWSDWQAFTVQEAGTTMCYLVSRPFSAVPAGRGWAGLGLTVARWPGRPDTVTLTAGSADISGVKGELRIGAEVFALETSPDGAFVSNTAAALEVMRQGLQAVAKFEGPAGARATVTYSLRGFRAAYGAARRVCPEH